MAELFSNNAVSTLTGSLSAVATSLTVQAGHGARFPNPTASDFFRMVLVRKSDGAIEIVFCTVRSGDIFTITRAQESTTALAFVASDIVELRPTAGFFTSLTVTAANIQANTFTYDATDTGSVNICIIQPSPAIAAYTGGQEFWWKVGVTNTGPSTLNVSALGTSPAIILQNGSALYAGALQATRIAHTIFDGTSHVLQNPYNFASVAGLITRTHDDINNLVTLAGLGRGGAVYNSANQSIPNNTTTILLFDSELYDTDSIHSTSTNTSRLTVPSGVTKVRLFMHSVFTANVTGYRQVSLRKNGAAVNGCSYSTGFGNAAIETTVPLVSNRLLVAGGDYFETAVYQNSGGALDVSGSAISTLFEMEIIS